MRKSVICVLMCMMMIFAINISAQIEFTEHSIATGLSRPNTVTAADFDQDGYMDFVSTTGRSTPPSGEIAWWHNDGEGNFTKHHISPEITGGRNVVAEDVDGDGEIDIVCANLWGNAIIYWKNDGEENFSENMMYIDNDFTSPHTVDVIDMDGDGHKDILCSGFDLDNNESEIAWWKNNGTSVFWEKHVISERFQRSPFIHGAFIDDDNLPDIVACGEGNGEIYWWRNLGNGDFEEIEIDSNYPLVHTVFARDVDMDGNTDIIGCGCGTSTIDWWRNDGNENFTRVHIGSVAGALWIDIADLDNDGDNDLFHAGMGENNIGWWLNPGDQDFVEQTIPGSVSGAFGACAADFDSDGDLDLMGAGWSSNRISWFENSLYSYGFSSDISTGHAPLAITFQDNSVAAFDITDWQWDIGDDGTVDATGQNPDITIDQAGYYDVRLTVSGNGDSYSIVKKDFIRVFDGESGLEFDGVNSYAYCEADPAIAITNEFSAEAWINPAGWGEHSYGFGRIIDKNSIQFYLHGAGSTNYNENSLVLRIKHEDNSYSSFCTGENSIILGGWQHVAAVYNGVPSETKIYINGEELSITIIDEGSGNIDDNSNAALYIGDRENHSASFDGVIDELRLWGVARSQVEIADNLTDIISPDEQGLLGYWQMNEANGEELFDSTTNGADATIENCMWAQGTPFQVTGIEEGLRLRKRKNRLNLHNYPNPFNPVTTISFDLPEAGNVEVSVYNIQGRLVKKLLQGEMAKGSHQLIWQGENESGRKVSSGIYLYEVKTKGNISRNKLVMVK